MDAVRRATAVFALGVARPLPSCCRDSVVVWFMSLLAVWVAVLWIWRFAQSRWASFLFSGRCLLFFFALSFGVDHHFVEADIHGRFVVRALQVGMARVDVVVRVGLGEVDPVLARAVDHLRKPFAFLQE